MGNEYNIPGENSPQPKPSTHHERALLMTIPQLQNQLEILEGQKTNAKRESKNTEALDLQKNIYSERYQTLLADQTNPEINEVETNIVRISYALGSLEDKKTPQDYFQNIGLKIRMKILQERRAALTQKAEIKKSSSPMQSEEVRVNWKTEDKPNAIRDGQKPPVLEVFRGYTQKEVESIKQSPKYMISHMQVNRNRELSKKEAVTRIIPAELSGENLAIIAQVEKTVRGFFNQKIARLGIPTNIPIVWPEIIIQNPKDQNCVIEVSP